MIEIEGVVKRFADTTVLDGLSLRFGARERVALVGANGAGKTTLVRCLLGEYRHQGSVRVAGLSPRSHRAAVLHRVGFVPQLPPPLKMPVTELLRFASGLCESRPEHMTEVAGQLGLDCQAVGRRPFVRLSGGQKQKLLIAIALGRSSDVLILDEPAANLDPDARQVFFDLLAERARTSTMLISSHRLDEVAPLVERVIELDQGRVVLDDCIADPSGLGRVLRCRVSLSRPDAAVEAALASWGLLPVAGGFEGTIAAADRLRFLGMATRYAGLLQGLDLHELDS
jgi:ABC-2 type transport system ATP-binding protein